MICPSVSVFSRVSVPEDICLCLQDISFDMYKPKSNKIVDLVTNVLQVNILYYRKNIPQKIQESYIVSKERVNSLLFSSKTVKM